jgi:signal transduction histidine kinase
MNQHQERQLEPHARRWIGPGLLAVTLITALVGALAVLGIRYVLRQDVEESIQARAVIAVAKMRSAAAREGGRVRGFLLTGDPKSLDQLKDDRRVFRTLLRELATDGSSTLHWDASGSLNQIRSTAQEYERVLAELIALRRRESDDEVVVRRFEQELRPLGAQLELSLDRLLGVEEGDLLSREQSTARAASSVATVSVAVALGAVAVSVLLGQMLRRSFRSLSSKQQQLEGAMLRLEAANHDLESFAGRVAHDLRTPLMPITLLAGKLSKMNADPEVTRCAERIVAAAMRASNMVEGLLAFSRTGQNAAQPTTEVARAADVIRETLDDLAHAIADEDIDVQTCVDPEVIVACDANLFRQIVANLLGNSVKFLNGCTRRLVTVRLTTEGSRCLLEVKDSGPGIPPELLGRIFEPFYRVPEIRPSGTGIGLATVRRIVEAHGGSVGVQSEIGRGSTFKVFLPRGRAAANGPEIFDSGMTEATQAPP